MNYNRKIFYMSLYEGDEKRGNVGFVKVIERKESREVEVCLQGEPMHLGDEVVLETLEGEKTLERQFLRIGDKGCVCHYVGKNIGVLERLRFVVDLSGEYMLASAYPPVPIVESKSTVEEKEDNLSSQTEELWMEQEILWEEPVENAMEDLEMIEEVAAEVKAEDEAKDKVENRKWKQICKVYPHIKPFGDFREYIKLELKDMVLVSEKKYSLVENSFLLHGYYNYGHLILWRKEKAPVKYYIGVPGNFYDKEKQVAVLYGFESFEGAAEPAGEGDFGYYMTEVML